MFTNLLISQGKHKKTQKVKKQRNAQLKRLMKPTDARIKDQLRKKKKAVEDPHQLKVHEAVCFLVSLLLLSVFKN